MAVYNDKDRLFILELKRQELLYEIGNNGYIIRDSVKRETPDEGKNIADINASGNADRISRLLDLAYADVMRMLSAHVDHRVDTDAYGNDIQQDPDSYFVMITLKHDMPGTTENLLRIYIHEFMVAKVMGEWLSVVAPEQAAVWANKAQTMETNITVAMSARKSITRIKPSPWC
jgi:hypothetical protein